MSQRRDVSPATVPVEVSEAGVTVEYLDGRRTRYDGPIEAETPPVRCAPGKQIHVLVVDPAAGRGVLVYVNDRNTGGDILEEAGVGRIMLPPGAESELLQGIVATLDGHTVQVDADLGAIDGRVFVFAEDEFGALAVELVAG